MERFAGILSITGMFLACYHNTQGEDRTHNRKSKAATKPRPALFSSLGRRLARSGRSGLA